MCIIIVTRLDARCCALFDRSANEEWLSCEHVKISTCFVSFGKAAYNVQKVQLGEFFAAIRLVEGKLSVLISYYT